MTQECPQETMGTTLLARESGEDFRRVYLLKRNGYVELGEFSRGPLTQGTFGAPTHAHSLHLEDMSLEEDLKAFFAAGEPQLADLMDELDAQNIPYGYLNSTTGSHVSYRPAKHTSS